MVRGSPAPHGTTRPIDVCQQRHRMDRDQNRRCRAGKVPRTRRPARSRLYFANSSGWALFADSRWRGSLSRRAFSATSAPAAEIRARKSCWASALVSFLVQVRIHALNLPGPSGRGRRVSKQLSAKGAALRAQCPLGFQLTPNDQQIGVRPRTKYLLANIGTVI